MQCWDEDWLVWEADADLHIIQWDLHQHENINPTVKYCGALWSGRERSSRYCTVNAWIQVIPLLLLNGLNEMKFFQSWRPIRALCSTVFPLTHSHTHIHTVHHVQHFLYHTSIRGTLAFSISPKDTFAHGAGDQPTVLQVSGWPALPLEPQLHYY